MNKSILFLGAAVISVNAAGQATQHEAFEQGKGYREANAHATDGINEGTAAAMPGRDTTRQASLESLYGTAMPAAGDAKVAECAAYVPGRDDYINQECATINYLRRNPEERPRTTISRSEPAIVTGTAVRSAPRAFTADQPGLSGTYTACIDRTTSSPVRRDKERCLIGHAVTEGSCDRKLALTYSWQAYALVPGAEPAYARCGSATTRGDRLTLPLAVTYREDTTSCTDRGHGTGTEVLVMRVDCTGAERLHGYDARRCSRPPDPAYTDPPRTAPACTTMPRTAEHCFRSNGTYVGKSQVPVFEDHWDDSACAEFDRSRGVITN